jgi:hypothetical protein
MDDNRANQLNPTMKGIKVVVVQTMTMTRTRRRLLLIIGPISSIPTMKGIKVVGTVAIAAERHEHNIEIGEEYKECESLSYFVKSSHSNN